MALQTIYEAFISKGVEAFRDSEKLQLGQEIASELIQAIEKSQYAIVVFSKKYADSRWCLDELAEIVECKKNKGLEVVPIFYHVDPSDVSKQTGPFEKAFNEHQKNDKIDRKKIQKWKDAMREVGNLSGEHLLKRQRSEAKCIKDIVEVISNKLSNAFSACTLGLIGIESRAKKLKSHLAIKSNDVRIIGIWGTGGIGKTTLARVVYEMVSNKFEACSFIANIREESGKRGLRKIQQILLNELLNDRDLKVQDVDKGVLMIKNRLRNKKILLVLDDVNELDQLKKLVGERCWFGSGSRIMITTRDKYLLNIHQVNDIYEVEALDNDEALKLFSLKAFRNEQPAEDYKKLSQAFVDYSMGLPLAIEVLGSFCFKKSIDECKSELDRLKEFPERGILNVLRISFHGLDETEKKIFLNIACFFNHMDKDNVLEILDSLELFPLIGLRVLVDKSLIKLHWNRLWMHSLLQDMGRDVVLQECPKDPGKRSRLWLYKDIDNVLITNTGTEAVEGIVLKLPRPIETDWNPESFSMMQHLKLLIINNVHLMHDPKHLSNELRFLDWHGYSSKSLPSSFQSNKLIEFHMCCSYIERLWKGTKSFERLKLIKLNKSQNLIETPDVTKIPVLEKLFLEDCINLLRVHQSIGVHQKLTILNLKGCKNLISLPNKFEMWSLEILILSGCSKVKKIPEFGKNMKLILNLYLDDTAITELPTSIGVLEKLTLLNLKACKSLKTLPSKFEMESLEILTLSDCPKVKHIPEFGGNMKRVCKLYLDGTAITKLPTSIEHLTDLTSINLRDCKNLVCLPNTIFNLKLLKDVNISGCSKLERLPDNLGNAESIEELDVSGTAIRQVPPSIGLLKNLKQLSFRGCKGLSSSKSKSWYDFLPFYSMLRCPDPVELSSLSLSGLCSLIKLDLSDCNLRAVPNDISCLFSLNVLILSGNDFGCLPESIAQLSSLRRLNLDNCTSLQSLPKLPLNIDYIRGFNCTSLETVPDLLKPNSSIEPTLNISDCSKLCDNQGFIDMFFAVIKKLLQGHSLEDRYLHKRYAIIFPGSKIPKWFRHQSIGAEVNIKEPFSHLCNDWMGIAVCVVFCSHPHHQIPNGDSLSCWLVANGKKMSSAPNTGHIVVLSDHIWLLYLLPQYYLEKQIKLLWECDANGFIRVGIRIMTHCSVFEVKRCGFRMVYKKDIEDVNRSMAQCSNNSIIPYRGLDVLHHKFGNAKRTRDDYDGAEPNGEGSSNDVPHPKRIVRSQLSTENLVRS
ncbi:hypothetical protein ACJW30_12G014100 [Castanea mollissima]